MLNGWSEQRRTYVATTYSAEIAEPAEKTRKVLFSAIAVVSALVVRLCDF